MTRMAALRHWSITIVTALVTAGVLVGAGLLIAGGGNGRRAEAGQTPAATAAHAAPRAGQSASPASPEAGSEGVPLTPGVPLGPASAPAPGASRGGVPCGSSEQLTYHVHARLTVFVNGKSRAVPLGIGIGAPRRISHTARGPFVAGGRCFSFLHTHATDGVIHIEAPAPIKFKLGQFFAVWRQRLDTGHLGPASGRVVAYVDGRRWRGDPRAIPLARHTQIQLEVGRPLVAPVSIRFPAGL